MYESPTIQSLLHCGHILDEEDKVIVWDNSPDVQTKDVRGILAKELTSRFEYRHTPENLSLARIYNTAIAENRGFDLLFLLDQDSAFDASYFAEIDKVSTKHLEVNLFLPLIRNGDKIVSPGHFYYFKGKYWDEPRFGLVKAQRNVAIASGMAIRMRYLDQFGDFEEQLQLYGIDTNFMLRYAKDNAFFYVVNVPFAHDLSDFNNEPTAIKRRRFEDFKKASLINAVLFPLPIRLLTRVFLWYRSIKF